MTEEGKRRMIEKNKGKHRSPQTEFKKGGSHIPWTTGKKMSDEFRKKLSESHKGQIAWNRTKIFCIENNVVYSSMKEASEKLNLTPAGISKVCRGIMQQTGGYHFKYYNLLCKSTYNFRIYTCRHEKTVIYFFVILTVCCTFSLICVN